MPLIPTGDMQEVSLALYSSQENLLDDSTRKVLLMFTPICFFPGNIPTEAMDTWKDLFGIIGGSALKELF
jgi:hypothetical protein